MRGGAASRMETTSATGAPIAESGTGKPPAEPAAAESAITEPSARRGVVDDKSSDDLSEEQRNVRNLIRVVGGFVAWPALSISVAFMLDIQEHIIHIAGLFPIGVAGAVLVIMAPKLAKKWAPDA
jgi:hypothetical protein